MPGEVMGVKGKLLPQGLQRRQVIWEDAAKIVILLQE